MRAGLRRILQFQSVMLPYRLSLARDGYALVKCELAVFKPEVE